MLMSPDDTDQEFITMKPEMKSYKDEILEFVDQVVLVKKLAETRVLTGFSRIKPSPYREFDQWDKSQLSLQEKLWLPSVRVYGEGIFFTLKKSEIGDWLARTDTRPLPRDSGNLVGTDRAKQSGGSVPAAGG